MKDKLLKFLKIFLFAALGILVILLVFGVVLSLDWPWWAGFFLLLAIVGAGIGALFLRKLWLRRREQHFVQQVIEQDEARLSALKGKEREEMKELQARWKEAIDALRRSHLRKYGNPLYVLPWYLVMGESGSGKTTAIKSARLSSPFAEVTRTPGISGTKNCDWWFFEQAVIIDTAGRYTAPVDEGRDREEWRKFLNLLVKYRKKEPLHGLIVTVAADKLLEGRSEALEEDGRNIRRRIDELMRAMGVKFPVYVLVTKCDLIQGMTRFCDHLPEESTDQPMGVINQDLSTDITAFLDSALNSMGERLRNLRILLLHRAGTGGTDPGLLLFPEEFENLRQGLESFMKGAFQENPYQETPVLRGLFFSSGRQEGTPYSHFLNTLGLISEKEVLPGTSRGLFLHDFFSKILPGDRGLFAPTSRAVQWQTFTRNLGLVSWVVIGVALCGLLSFSFVKNLRTLRGASHEFAKQPALQGMFMPDLVTMNRFNNAILTVEERNRDWWIPRFGLYESINAEKGLKENFSRRFREGFMAPLDRQMVQKLTAFTPVTPDEVVGRYAALLARRINLLNARLRGEDEKSIRAKPVPPYEPLISAVSPDAGPDATKKFGELYLYYIIRRTDTGEMGKEIDIFQSWLKHLLALKGRNPRWIASWVDRSGAVPSLTPGDFWGGDSPPEAQEATVAPAFTLRGREMIDSFIKEIEAALPDPLVFADRKLEFMKWYRDSSFRAWQEFGASFSKGMERLSGRDEWRNTAATMAAGKGPYFAFLQRMTADLEPLAEKGDLPPWLRQAYELRKIGKIGSTVGGTIAKAAEKGKKVISALERRLGREGGRPSGEESLSIKAYTEYQKALNEITPVTASAGQAYKTALQVFTEDPAVSKSPFYAGYRAASALKTGVADGKPSAVVSDIITGPLDFLWEYTLRETACRLQNEWESGVLAEIQGASRQQAIELLLGQNGYAWKFVKEPAAPFVRYRQGRGYRARKIFGRGVPFRPAFFTFLRKGAGAHADALTRQNYNVLIRGLPTDANQDSRLKPHATHLELQCTDRTYRLDNYQFPVSRTFRWSPGTCGDVVFSIEVGDLTLAKTYRGPQAFVDFLDEFRTGRRTFYPKEFPAKRRDLGDLGIRYIRVNYKFRGAGAVLKKFRFSPGEIVRSISHCWDQ